MADDTEYLANYKVNQIYTHPGKDGAFATIVGDSEEPVGEVDVTPRCKLAISAFYVNDKRDFGSLKIRKLRYHATHGCQLDGQIQVNKFQVEQMGAFLAIISRLDLADAQKTKILMENIHLGVLAALLNSTKAKDLIKELAETPSLHHDIYAVAAKRQALAEFEGMLGGKHSERDWQGKPLTPPFGQLREDREKPRHLPFLGARGLLPQELPAYRC